MDQAKFVEDSLLKILKWFQIFWKLSSTNFNWSILEYLGPNGSEVSLYFQNLFSQIFLKKKAKMVTHIRLYLVLFGVHPDTNKIWKVLQVLENGFWKHFVNMNFFKIGL